MFENIEGILAVVFEYACDETRKVDRFAPVAAFKHEWQNARAHCVH